MFLKTLSRVGRVWTGTFAASTAIAFSGFVVAHASDNSPKNAETGNRTDSGSAVSEIVQHSKRLVVLTPADQTKAMTKWVPSGLESSETGVADYDRVASFLRRDPDGQTTGLQSANERAGSREGVEPSVGNVLAPRLSGGGGPIMRTARDPNRPEISAGVKKSDGSAGVKKSDGIASIYVKNALSAEATTEATTVSATPNNLASTSEADGAESKLNQHAGISVGDENIGVAVSVSSRDKAIPNTAQQTASSGLYQTKHGSAGTGFFWVRSDDDSRKPSVVAYRSGLLSDHDVSEVDDLSHDRDIDPYRSLVPMAGGLSSHFQNGNIYHRKHVGGQPPMVLAGLTTLDYPDREHTVSYKYDDAFAPKPDLRGIGAEGALTRLEHPARSNAPEPREKWWAVGGGNRSISGYSADNADCLSRAVYYEARGESAAGQIAVAKVIMNRVKHSRFPDTICEVVYQNASEKHRCQFSFACDGKSDRPRDMNAFKQAKAHARMVLANDAPSPDISGATHYHADYVNPNWSQHLGMVAKIDTHIFYNMDMKPVATAPQAVLSKPKVRESKPKRISIYSDGLSAREIHAAGGIVVRQSGADIKSDNIVAIHSRNKHLKGIRSAALARVAAKSLSFSTGSKGASPTQSDP